MQILSTVATGANRLKYKIETMQTQAFVIAHRNAKLSNGPGYLLLFAAFHCCRDEEIADRWLSSAATATRTRAIAASVAAVRNGPDRRISGGRPKLERSTHQRRRDDTGTIAASARQSETGTIAAAADQKAALHGSVRTMRTSRGVRTHSGPPAGLRCAPAAVCA